MIDSSSYKKKFLVNNYVLLHDQTRDQTQTEMIFPPILQFILHCKVHLLIGNGHSSSLTSYWKCTNEKYAVLSNTNDATLTQCIQQ